jgi:starvation-inducible outer membrane lipoprotein
MKNFGPFVWRRITSGQNVFSDAKRKPRRQPAWGILSRVFALGIWCLAAGACAHPISSQVRAEADSTLTLSKVIENPRIYLGSIVIWGGVVSNAWQGPEGTRLLVIQTPLDSHGDPQTRVTQGEFIAWTSESLDSRVYRRGLTITLAGEIDDVEEKNLDPTEYPRPVLRIIQLHPWEKKHLPLSHGNWEGGFNFPSSPFEESFPGREEEE